jgi:hypothetical protein
MEPGPDREPRPPGGDEEEQERDRVRRTRGFWRYAQAGGLVFLAVTSLGLIPTIVSASFPALGPKVAIAVWVVAPAVALTLLVVAAYRITR